jgi:hypothetical protein
MSLLAIRCSPFRPSCTGESGPVTSLTATVRAGDVTVHTIAYGTEGSQNDITVSWTDQGQPDAPDVRFSVTRASCETFLGVGVSPECAVLARAGRIDGHVVVTMIVTHGRGNPERLGNPPAFKVWVEGDGARSAGYTIVVQWKRPVEC